jgi:hypothetical protein
MRRPLIFGLLSLGMVGFVSAHQHASVAVAPAPPAIHLTPSAPVSVSHVVHTTAPSQAHPATHAAPSAVKPGLPHRAPNRPVSPLPAPAPVIVNPLSNFPVSSSCNRRSNYPLQGSGACQPFTGVILPFFGGAVYVPVPYVTDSAAPEDAQEDASNVQSDSGNSQESAQDSSAPTAGPARYSSNRYEEPCSEFVFVQRDGNTFYAVAYSLSKDRVQYVTKDGLRRTLTLDSLDFDATQKSNEERGNTINLPSPPTSGVALEVPPAPLR